MPKQLSKRAVEAERKAELLAEATGAKFKPGGEMYFDRLLTAYAAGEPMPDNNNVSASSVAFNLTLKYPGGNKRADKSADVTGPFFVDVERALLAAEERGRCLAERATLAVAGGTNHEPTKRKGKRTGSG